MRSQKKIGDPKNISENSTFFEFTFLLDATSDRTSVTAHLKISILGLVMFEKRFISLNWAIHKDFWQSKNFFKLEILLSIIYQWLDQTKIVINCPWNVFQTSLQSRNAYHQVCCHSSAIRSRVKEKSEFKKKLSSQKYFRIFFEISSEIEKSFNSQSTIST